MNLLSLLMFFYFLKLSTCIHPPWHINDVSYINSSSGHYPHEFYNITNVVLKDREFSYFSENKFSVNQDIWTIVQRKDNDVKCEKTFNIGFVYLFYYYYG